MGIVRVERELARWAHAHRPDVEFCVYDKQANSFHKLDRQKVPAILAGELLVTLDETPSESPALPSARYWLRGQILRRPRLYQQIQKLRGRHYALAEIEEVLRRETGGGTFNDPTARLSLEQATVGEISLHPEDTVISGGLDWEHKDMRGIFALKNSRPFKYAAILYDLIPVNYPQFVVPSLIDRLRDYFGELPWVADYALCISACSQRDLIAYCGRSHVSPPPAMHFPLGSGLPDSVYDEDDFPTVLEGKSYCLFVSTIEPRKNHRLLYQAWARLLQEGKLDSDRHRMVFVGRAGWNVGDLMHELHANPLTTETIVRLENVPDGTLDELYRRADFIVFPSLYEGFGLPLAEALAHGRPCLSSDRGALPEVGGDCVRYLSPEDPLAWAAAIEEMFTVPAAREQAERAARRYTPLSWAGSGEIFFERLNKLMMENPA